MANDDSLTMDKKVQELEQKIAKMQLDINRNKQELKKRQRAIDTRRKILLGAFFSKMLDENEFGEDFKNTVCQKLDTYLTKQSDRALFEDLLGKKEENSKFGEKLRRNVS